jgi:hypothetical protein
MSAENSVIRAHSRQEAEVARPIDRPAAERTDHAFVERHRRAVDAVLRQMRRDRKRRASH